MDYIVIFLLVFIAIREVFFAYTIHKLTDKLMSRNFYEYQQAKKILQKQPATKIVEIPSDPFENENLGAIL